jgi:hypothetical protein
MSGWMRARAAVALAAAWGVGPALAPAPAGAESCPNAQYRTGPSAHLPDCRAYEQVSPPEKGSEDAFGEGGFSQAGEAEGHVRLAYTSKNVFAGSRGAGVDTAYLATREGAWSTEALTPQVLAPVPADSLTYAFSGDLSQTLVRVPLEALTPEAPAGVYNLFVRQPDGDYSLVTAAAPSVPVAAGCDTCYFEHDVPAFMGASSDFQRVFFEANESLLTTPSYPADPEHVEDLYESDLGEGAGERVHPVGILPGGAQPAGGAQLGAGGGNVNAEGIEDVRHAISADGSRVLFTAKAGEGAPGELYDRIGGPSGSTIEVSAPAPGAEASKCETPHKNCKAEAAQFWDASEDGSVVLFSSRAELTKASNTGPEQAGQENAGEDLYRYDVETKELVDLTPDETGAGASVQGVVGASADAEYVYYVAEGVLAGRNALGAEPIAGKDNLYLTFPRLANGHPVEETVFVATLAEAGEETLGDSQDWTPSLEDSQAYVTPNGEHLAFTSTMALTGYDNEDQRTEAPDKEVFEYTAPIREEGREAPERLQCASCNPDAALRPVGNAFIGREIAAQSEDTGPLYQARALNEEGTRLFFSSADSLVPESANPYVKVYEFEDGAVHLISGGGAESNDIFMDSSPSGDDVFFATAQQLTPSDRDQASDVYDARVEGGLPFSPSSSSPCEGEGCLPPPSAPPTLPTPGSTLNGIGNLAPAQGVAPAHATKAPAPLTRAQKLARALKACRREPKRKRAACVKLAERRYGHAAPKKAKPKHKPKGKR